MFKGVRTSFKVNLFKPYQPPNSIIKKSSGLENWVLKVRSPSMLVFWVSLNNVDLFHCTLDLSDLSEKSKKTLIQLIINLYRLFLRNEGNYRSALT